MTRAGARVKGGEGHPFEIACVLLPLREKVPPQGADEG